MRRIHPLILGVLSVSLLSMSACKRVVLRDAATYKNEIHLLEMTIEQDTELLREHLADGACKCDEEGNWSSESCETAALNVLVMEKRLKWHVAMMMYLGGLAEENPGEEPPVSEEEISTLCPPGE
jgi:hypothetical protein